MTSPTTIKNCLGVFAIGLTLAAVAEEATAAPYRYVSAGEPIADNTQDGIEAVCPGDEPVVSGGVAATGILSSRVEINTSQPYDADGDGTPDDGWQGYVDNLNSGDVIGETYGVFAICDKRATEADYRYRTSMPKPAPDGQQTFVSLRCAGDEPVTGGGIRSSGFLNDGMHVSTTRPVDGDDPGQKTDDGWIAWVDNEPFGQSGQQVTGFVICDRRRSTDFYRYPSASATSTDGQQASVSQPCPTGTRLAGGGLRSSGRYVDQMYATGNSGLIAPGGTMPTVWQAEVNNLSGGSPVNTLTAYAICR